MLLRFLTAASLLALAALPAQAQRRDRDADEDRDVESRLDTTVTLDRGATVELTLTAGEIRVTGWDRREAKIHAYSERGTLRFDATSSHLELGVRSRSGRSGDTRYELSVPVGTRVLMRSVSGDLMITGVRAEVEAHSVSGDIEIADAADRVTAESVSGSVMARGVTGGARIGSVSGELELDRVTGDVEAQTVSGEIIMRTVRAKLVRARTTSGEVEFDGTIDPSGRYDFDSHSGNIRLSLPANVSALLDVETYSGDIDSDFPVRLEPASHATSGPRRLEFRIGEGGARISAETFSGNVEIVRAGATGREPR